MEKNKLLIAIDRSRNEISKLENTEFSSDGLIRFNDEIEFFISELYRRSATSISRDKNDLITKYKVESAARSLYIKSGCELDKYVKPLRFFATMVLGIVTEEILRDYKNLFLWILFCILLLVIFRGMKIINLLGINKKYIKE